MELDLLGKRFSLSESRSRARIRHALDHFDRRSDSVVDRGAAYLALQLRLGLLPRRGPWSHPHHRAHSGPNRTNLSAGDAGKTGLRVFRGLHVPSLAIDLLAKGGSPARSGAAALVKIKSGATLVAPFI
jgi:hypothetical protein